MARQLNALIVDDSYTTRKLVMRALAQTGLADFTFTEADDGIDALDKYRPGETEIIFVDMNMPRMDGLQFIRELRSRHRDCPPTVMITAESSRERLSEALSESGVDAFLLKPVDRDRLQEGLRKLVDSIPERSGACIVPHGECVARAAQEILPQACGLELTTEPADEAVRAGKAVLGMISIHGAVHWSVMLGFTEGTAKAAASRFAGYEIPADSPDMGDAIGEITNIVGGRVKLLLASRGLKTNVSLPAVIGASGFQILLQRKNTADYVHFDSPVGKLWTMVAVGVDAETIL